MAEFLIALADFDRQRLWRRLGHTSLFSFLLRHLGLSRSAAFYRHTAVQLVQRFPEVIQPLRDGRLCHTAIVELAKVMTPENRSQVLPRFFSLSKREAREVAAEIAPHDAPPRREVVTAVRPEEPTLRKIAGAPSDHRLRPGPPPALPVLGPSPFARVHVEPLTAELRAACTSPSRSDKRDGGRCQWRLESGQICGSNVRVQIDHVQPRALGGASTAENGRLLCAAHNLMAARHFFGDSYIDKYGPS